MVDEHEHVVMAVVVVALLRVTAAVDCSYWEPSPNLRYYYGECRCEYIDTNLLLLLEVRAPRVGGSFVSLCVRHYCCESRGHYNNARLYHYCGHH